MSINLGNNKIFKKSQVSISPKFSSESLIVKKF